MQHKEVGNSFRVHLHLAASSEKVWKAAEAVFVATKEERIQGMKGDLTQYPFFHLSSVKDADRKIKLLTDLAGGIITVEELREKTKPDGYDISLSYIFR